jgi:EAL domain-containing protein (putative c-di-GMP-specific phosphodiesterase class I)
VPVWCARPAPGLDVVAEGIETAEQAEELARLGCEVGQGYFFARPLAPDSRLLAAQPQLP